MEGRWCDARVATIDGAGNVYVALALDEEGGTFAVWSFARDGSTRWWTVLDEMSASGIVVDGAVVRVVSADASVALAVADGSTVERSETSIEARVLRCSDGTFLVVGGSVTHVESLFASPWKKLPIFPRQEVEKPGFLASLFGGGGEERDPWVRGTAAACMPRGDLVVFDPDEKTLVRYDDAGDVVLRVKPPFREADEIQAINDDAYILTTNRSLWLLRDGDLRELGIENVDAFAVDREAGIWVFRGPARELVAFK